MIAKYGMVRLAMLWLFLAALFLANGCTPNSQDEAKAPVVLAASSLQESLEAAADAFAAKGHARPILSFAASSALARQIDSGAPADLFVSADQGWMDEVERSGRIEPASRADLIGNALVLVAPKDSGLRWQPDQNLAQRLATDRPGARLAMGDPDAVPAGKYGKAALQSLNQWKAAQPLVVRGENVRAALAFVERGEAAAGIVYATDAAASRKVRIVTAFPADSHPPITYPIARLASSNAADARAFQAFLLSPEGQAILRRYGFTAP